jgi:hypothetical protein
VSVASEIPETGIESIVYDNDNDLTTIGSSWGVTASGTADINFDQGDNTFYIDVSADRIGVGTNSPGHKLDVQGGDINTSGKIREAGNALVPAGLVMMFNLASCPSGWTEVTAARGRALVGLPSGGTLLGVPPGISAYTNLEVRTHSHDLRAHTHQVDPDGAGHDHGPGIHTHQVNPDGAGHSHGPGNHTHTVDADGGGGHTHPVGSHTHPVNPPNTTSGGPSGTANVNTGTLPVGDSVHTHNVDILEFTSGSGSGNTGTGNLGAATTSTPSADNTATEDMGAVTSGTPSASNTGSTDLGTSTSAGPSTDATSSDSHTIPYIQLLVCEKA